MKYITLCSGIECASVAALPLGWEPICFSEIEPFPFAVLAHHYPEVPNVGDMMTHDWRQYRGRCDAIIAGTPCQAFSVAGLGDSLDDERGQLTLKFVEICNDVNPTVIIWENVPGVLSTKDNAFGCFLGAMVGEPSPIVPVGKWTDAGVVVGPERRIAWRILDAQYFGLAQRRRRLFLVASPRTDGIDPAKVLFEFEGVRRYSAPSRGTQKDPAAGTGGSAPGGGERGGDSVAGTGSGKWAKGTGGPSGHECQNLVAGTLCNNKKAAGSATLQDAKSGLLIAGTIDASACRSRGAGISPGMLVAGAQGGEGGRVEVESWGISPDCFDRSGEGRNGTAGERSGLGVDYELAYALRAKRAGGVAHTLRSNGFDASEDGCGRGTPLVPIAFHPTQDPIFRPDMSHAVGCGSSSGQCNVAVALRSRDGSATAELGGEVSNAVGTGDGGSSKACVLTSAVRRLTPRECERLQGFPDDYTKIPWHRFKKKIRFAKLFQDYQKYLNRGGDKGFWDLHSAPADGPRYKAIGNSMPEPVMRWIFRRADQAMAAHHSFSEDREG